MVDKLKKFQADALEWIKKISKKIWIISAVVLVSVAVLIAFFLNNKPYEVLVTGVSSGEASSILTFLEGQGVTNYKVEKIGRAHV